MTDQNRMPSQHVHELVAMAVRAEVRLRVLAVSPCGHIGGLVAKMREDPRNDVDLRLVLQLDG